MSEGGAYALRPGPPIQPPSPRRRPRLPPNGPCPCGSGRKYKRCCMRKPLRTSRLWWLVGAAVALGITVLLVWVAVVL
ncbi:MAG: SEC-C metal-binding domain-containing protein [Planctomycetota bacterium]